MQHARQSFLSILALLVALVVGLPATSSAQVASATDVRIAIDSTGVPGSSRDRREEVVITQALATALGITTVDAGGDDSPQIRVVVTTDPTTSSPMSSGLYTVTGIVAGTTPRIDLWESEGRTKLFPSSSSSTNFSSARATVYDVAPSRTVEGEFQSYGRVVDTETVHYFEPGQTTNPPTGTVIDPDADSRKRFEEFYEVNPEHHIAVLVPHGGDIETDISQHLWRVANRIDLYTPDRPDIWEGYGTWGSSQTLRRWHITATALHAPSFPGLDALAANAPYRYGVAIHGYTGRRETEPGTEATHGIIIGGRSTRQEKCYMAVAIQSWLGSSRDEVALAIVYRDGSLDKALHVPNSAGQTIHNVDDYMGIDTDNLLDRIAPNATFAAGQGGFQFELSKELRLESYIGSVLSGIGEGIGQLHTYHQAAEDDNACGDLVVPSGQSTSVETL